MRLTATVAAALTLSACAATPAIESALAPLTGQPVQLVFERLGSPSSTTPAGLDTIYGWHSTKLVPGAITTAQTIPPGAESGPRYSGMAVPYSCDLRILVGADQTIKDWHFTEQTGGCRESARSLRQLAYVAPR